MSTKLGLIGEFISLATLNSFDGWKAVHAPMDRIDVLAFGPGETFIRVQVKTSTLARKGLHASFTHHFQLGHGCKAKHLPKKEDYDVLCLVSPNARRCKFLPVMDVKQYSMRVWPDDFTVETERETWLASVAKILELRR